MARSIETPRPRIARRSWEKLRINFITFKSFSIIQVSLEAKIWRRERKIPALMKEGLLWEELVESGEERRNRRITFQMPSQNRLFLPLWTQTLILLAKTFYELKIALQAPFEELDLGEHPPISNICTYKLVIVFLHKREMFLSFRLPRPRSPSFIGSFTIFQFIRLQVS